MPEHPRGEAPITGRAPVEWIGDLKDVMDGEKSQGGADPLSSAIVGFLTPTMSYTGAEGKLKDQEFAPPAPENLKGPTALGAFYGQTPYSDATWLLFANPLSMFLVGLGVGAYESRLRARKKVSDSVDAAKLKEENEKLKGALDELKQYAQQTQTPGQMGGGYAAGALGGNVDDAKMIYAILQEHGYQIENLRMNQVSIAAPRRARVNFVKNGGS